MPVYDFVCECGNEFEAFLHSHRKPNPPCTLCNSDTKRKDIYNTLIDMDGFILATPRKKADLASAGAKLV
jgi:putative FmdB family regulatory protein